MSYSGNGIRTLGLLLVTRNEVGTDGRTVAGVGELSIRRSVLLTLYTMAQIGLGIGRRERFGARPSRTRFIRAHSLLRLSDHRTDDGRRSDIRDERGQFGRYHLDLEAADVAGWSK